MRYYLTDPEEKLRLIECTNVAGDNMLHLAIKGSTNCFLFMLNEVISPEKWAQKIELQQKVYSAFSEVRDYTLTRKDTKVRWFSVNANKHPEEITKSILNIVDQQLLLIH